MIKTKLILQILLIILCLQFVSSAHWIVGYVNNADDGTPAENFTVAISKDLNFIDNVTGIIGIYGSAAADNVYLIDCEMLSSPCNIDDVVYAKVFDDDGDRSNIASTIVTASGYDLMPSLKLYSSTDILNIVAPINNSYNKTAYFEINISYDNVDSCFYSVDDSVNESINVISEYNPSPTGFSFSTVGGGSDNPTTLVKSGDFLWIVDSTNAEVYKYHINGTYTGESFDTASSGNLHPNGITTDGIHFWITYDGLASDNRVYKYFINGTYVSNFQTHASNNNPYGITQNGTFIWVNEASGLVFKYDMSGSYVSFFNIQATQVAPKGMVYDGSHLFITDLTAGKIYKYFINGTYTEESFELGAFTFPTGLTKNETYFWTIYGGNVYKYYTNGTYTGDSFNTFDSQYASNYNPYSITQNGTYFWIVDRDDDEVYKYYINGTYTGDSFATEPLNNFPSGITQNGNYIFISDSFHNKVYKYHMNGTYSNLNFSSSGGAISCNTEYCLELDLTSNSIQNYSVNGTFNGNIFNLDSDNFNPFDLFFNDNGIFVTDIIDNKFYRYNYTGTLIDSFQEQYANTYGIDGNLTNIFIIDKPAKKVNFYNILSDTNKYSITNESISDGSYNVSFNCNDTSNIFLFSDYHYFTIDTIFPEINITDISTTVNSQTISFNSTVNDTNIGPCKYSIYNSLGDIDGLNENITFTCNNISSATSTSYGAFTLKIYSQDLAGNENSTNQSYVVSSSPGGGGGGGSSEVEIEKVPVIALLEIIGEKIYSDLERAIIYARINSYCSEIKTDQTFAIQDFSGECQLKESDIVEIQSNLQKEGFLIDKEDLILFYDKYKSEELEQSFQTLDVVETKDLFTSVLGITNPMLINPPRLDQPFIIFKSGENVTIEKTFTVNKNIRSCDIVSGEGFSCEIITNNSVKMILVLNDTDFFDEIFQGEMLIVSDADPANLEVRRISLNVRVYNFSYKFAGIQVMYIVVAIVILIIAFAIVTVVRARKGKRLKRGKS